MDTKSAQLKIENVTNAFLKIQRGDQVMLADPWVTEGIFDGGWTPYPPIRDPGQHISKCDFVYISHIHEDHFDVDTLARLPRSCTAIVPDIYPNHIIQNTLHEMGFQNVLMIKPFVETRVGPNLTVEVIPPLNAADQEQLFTTEGLDSVAVDSGLSINWDGVKVILMNDNTPYDLSLLNKGLQRFMNCDLLAINYNGASDDYPICYRGFTDLEKSMFSNYRDEVKLQANTEIISMLKPQAVLSYSSEFSVRGPQAIQFASVRTGLYSDKRLMAQKLQDTTGVPAYAIFEGDSMELTQSECKVEAGNLDYPPLLQQAETLYTLEPNYSLFFPGEVSRAGLRQDTEVAASHMFRYMKNLGFECDWIFEVNLNDGSEPLCVDFLNHTFYEGPAESGRKLLRCFTDPRYYNALLHRLTHWNNAMISYNLEWERIPNEYDLILYRALNFLHV